MIRQALLAVALLAAACGYRFERDRSLHASADGTIPKVALKPFDTTSYRRGLEITLTQLVDDELRSRTGRAPYAPEEAEILLGGTITRADERVISEDTRDVIVQSSFLIDVEVELRDPASGNVLGTYKLTEREPFSDQVGRIRTEQEAALAALRDLSERIVYLLETQNRPKEQS
jgi:hypothetical protein